MSPDYMSPDRQHRLALPRNDEDPYQIGTRDYIGHWAVCSIGRLGKIEGFKTLAWGESWVGTGIDGKPWASRHPRLLCEADASQIEALAAMRPQPGA